MTTKRPLSAVTALTASTLLFSCSEAEPGPAAPVPVPGMSALPGAPPAPGQAGAVVNPSEQIPIAPVDPAAPGVPPAPPTVDPAQPTVDQTPAATAVTPEAPMVDPAPATPTAEPALPPVVTPPPEMPAPVEPTQPAEPVTPVVPPTMEPPPAEPAGDPLLGGLTEEQAMERYYFKQEGGAQVVVEGEHFVSQAYCDSDVYRGKRWWMVHTVEFQPKGTPEFSQRCEEARQEFMDIDMDVDGNKNIADICSAGRGVQFPIWDERRSTNNESASGKSANEVFEDWGCDPRDANRSDEASAGSYVKLLPDMLYLNHNAIPHTLSNWHNIPFQAPKAYYRINFSEGGRYQIRARAMRGGTDSGDMWLTVASSPGMEPRDGNQNWARVAGPEGNFGWVDAGTHNIEAGEFYIVIAGREDGFFFDKMVISKGGCQGCGGDKDSPPESTTMNE